ncbi:MAG: hypothetical protein ACK55I_30050, partial [bacterium]
MPDGHGSVHGHVHHVHDACCVRDDQTYHVHHHPGNRGGHHDVPPAARGDHHGVPPAARGDHHGVP